MKTCILWIGTLVLSLAVSSEASPSNQRQLQSVIKTTVAKQFGVMKKGIAVTLGRVVTPAPPRFWRGRAIPQKVRRFNISSTRDSFVAIVPAAPEREGFKVIGTINKKGKTARSISGLKRETF